MTSRNRLFSRAFALALFVGAAASDAAAQPKKIHACQTLTSSGSYILMQDLLVASGDCLIVDHDFTTIDFNGFAIIGVSPRRGGESTAGIGIRSGQGGRGTEIRNGTITRMATGIHFRPIPGVLIQLHVERMRILDNREFGLISGDVAIVRDSIFRDNGADGIFVDSYSVVTGNTSSRNGGNGIVVGNGSTVSGNTASQNTSDGLQVVRSTVSNNTAVKNGQSGISAQCASNVMGNTLTENTTNLVLTGAGCMSEHNVVMP